MLDLVTVDILTIDGYLQRYYYNLQYLTRIKEGIMVEEGIEELEALRVINREFKSIGRRYSLLEIAWRMTENDLFKHFKQSRYTTYQSLKNRLNRDRNKVKNL